MKAKRQQEILRIIEEQDVDTQDQLLAELRARGVQSTQATISRDIKELHLVKELTGYGTYRYAVSERKASLNFAGRLRAFSLPLLLVGTPFQRAVWEALAATPYAATTTYAALARSLGRPTATRAVAAAVGSNPIAPMLPCHRIVGSDGNLTGYAGGLTAKAFLLGLERRHAAPPAGAR